MKKVLIIANMLIVSASVFGMNVPFVNQKNNENALIKIEDLSEHEQNIRTQMMEQIDEVRLNTNFYEIQKRFEIAKEHIERTVD